MQQFTVPQFIDVEDKIIGPITTRQFLILMGGFVLIAMCYAIFDFSAFVFFSLIIFALSGIFAFFRVNGVAFHYFILNFIQTVRRAPLRIWNKTYGKENFDRETTVIAAAKPVIKHKQLNISRLNELTLMVDTQGAYKGGENKDEVRLM
jgi:hypothetical protein